MAQDCSVSSMTPVYRCSGNTVQKQTSAGGTCQNSSCVYSNFYWQNTQDCGAIGQACQNGACTSYSTGNLSVSCYANPNPANVNQAINFYANAIGGTGNYSYQWTGACNGTSSNCTNSFSSVGNYTATVSVSSGGITNYANCSVSVGQNNNYYQNNLRCWGGDVYWFDNFGNPASLYQKCSSSSNCDSDNNGPTYCANNAVYRMKTCYSGGCSNGACISSSSGSELLETCGPNRTCTAGRCEYIYPQQYVNPYSQNNYTPPAPTATTPPATNYQAPSVPGYIKNYKIGCDSNNLYWFDTKGAKGGLYKSCNDNNNCTLDVCRGNGCLNEVKCDGSTCAKTSLEYCNNCKNHCGDGVCNCGETIGNCQADCSTAGGTTGGTSNKASWTLTESGESSGATANRISQLSAAAWSGLKNMASKWYVWAILIIAIIAAILVTKTEGGVKIAVGYFFLKLFSGKNIIYLVVGILAVLVALAIAISGSDFFLFLKYLFSRWYIWFLLALLLAVAWIRSLDKQGILNRYKGF